MFDSVIDTSLMQKKAIDHYPEIGPITAAVLSLERHLGDPCSPGAAISFERNLILDELDEFPRDEIDALNAWGFNSQYVPKNSGGRLGAFDELVIMIRNISRRDLTVAIAHAKTFFGSVPVWIGGSQMLKKKCAAFVLNNKPVALGLAEKIHGSDLFNNECRLDLCSTGHYALTGEKRLINNATRSDAITMYCAVTDGNRDRGSALAFVVKEDISPASFRHFPKEKLLGIRGADISGIGFDNAVVRKESIVGAVGAGLKLTLLSLQLSRILCCGFSLGAGDSALRMTLRLVRENAFEPHPFLSAERASYLLSKSFTLQLAADCMTLVACRAVHVFPEQVVLISAVAKYSVPTMTEKIFSLMSSLHGVNLHYRAGYFAAFQKIQRDNRVVNLFDGSAIVNLQSLISQLRHISEHRRTKTINVPNAHENPLLKKIFRITEIMPEINFSRLDVNISGRDLVFENLGILLSQMDADDPNDDLVTQVRHQIKSLLHQIIQGYNELLDKISSHSNRFNGRESKLFDYAKRYCDLYVAASSFCIWHFNQDILDDEFYRGEWLVHILQNALSSEVDIEAGHHEKISGWMNRLYEEQRGFSVLPMPALFDSDVDA